MMKRFKMPRIVFGALKGGSGKTLISVGVVAALRKRGLKVAVFKKGPDYIDAGWLGLAAGVDCHNLDAYLFSETAILDSFVSRSSGADISIIEGNRGLFDGVDAAGTFGTAELAKLLKAPLLLIIDSTKMTRTAAALTLGCKALDPELQLEGVIINRVAGQRHCRILTESIESLCSVPVIGSINKLDLQSFPQRHLGLLPLHEHPEAMRFIEQALEIVENSVDIERLLSIANDSGDFALMSDSQDFGHAPRTHENVIVGALKDSAFQFYYPENLEALTVTGASLREINSLEPKELPEIDALYIGGGFPETNAERLADNFIFRDSLRRAVENGLPVYAECGGLMYLSRSLQIDENNYPMVGIFDMDSVLAMRPQGHGYIHVKTVSENPFYPVGASLVGHEFHYSYVANVCADSRSFAFEVTRGHGIDGRHDGIFRKNALATYAHVHALGEPLWAKGILDMANRYKRQRAVASKQNII